MSENAITEQLNAARRELRAAEDQAAKWQQQSAILRARVDAFEVAAKYIEEMAVSRPADRKAPQKKRTPASDWPRIFQELYERYNAGFGYDPILAVASRLGIELKRDSLRNKMMKLAQDGYIDRLADGEFRITPSGVKFFGLEKKVPDAKAPGTEVLGPVTGRGDGYPPAHPSGSIPDGSTDTPPYDPPSWSGDSDDDIPF